MTTMETTTRRLTTAETAKHIRKALKGQFPGTKFSVRSRTYAGGSSIDIRWTDGPRERAHYADEGDGQNAVWNFAQQFAGADFDGMTDMRTYRPSTLFANEDGTFEDIRWGADFIFTHRSIGDEYRAECEAAIAEATGRSCDLAEYGGRDWNTAYAAMFHEGRICRCKGSTTDGRDLFHQYTARAR